MTRLIIAAAIALTVLAYAVAGFWLSLAMTRKRFRA